MSFIERDRSLQQHKDSFFAPGGFFGPDPTEEQTEPSSTNIKRESIQFSQNLQSENPDIIGAMAALELESQIFSKSGEDFSTSEQHSTARSPDSKQHVKKTYGNKFLPKKHGRTPWTKSGKYMSAYEIDNMIRYQEQQLHSVHPFVDDYYYQHYLKRQVENCVKSGQDIPENLELPMYLHAPLYDVPSYPTYSRKVIELGQGTLGKIPGFSTRAPRQLLSFTLDKKDTDAPRETSSLLMLESAFDRILDIEDIDNLLKFAKSHPAESVKQHLQHREETIQSLFDLIPVFVLKPDSPTPRQSEGSICSWEEDIPLFKVLILQKGRKMISRLMPLLPGYFSHALFLAFMRNLGLLLRILQQYPDSSSTVLFYAMSNTISTFNIPQIRVCLEVLLHTRTDELISEVLKSWEGLQLLQMLLVRVYGQMMEFTPDRGDIAQFQMERQQWYMALQPLFTSLHGNLDQLFETPSGVSPSTHFELLCNFLSSLVLFASPSQCTILLAEIGPKMQNVPKLFPESIHHARHLVLCLTRPPEDYSMMHTQTGMNNNFYGL